MFGCMWVSREVKHTQVGAGFARTRRAWWDCKQQEDNTWKIHFVADAVKRQDLSCTNDELFSKIEESYKEWIVALDALPALA